MNYNDLVIIHDAARPFVTKQDIKILIEASAGFDGVTPVIKINDTVYQSKDKRQITALLNRDELFAGQTPECYNFGKYLLAHKQLSDEDIGNIRGSSEVAFISGMNIGLCEGNIDNFKISTMQDLEYFKYRLALI
jgi:2-C-methyl-D-erythritol 4-phosphate cytidylyltransferase